MCLLLKMVRKLEGILGFLQVCLLFVFNSVLFLFFDIALKHLFVLHVFVLQLFMAAGSFSFHPIYSQTEASHGLLGSFPGTPTRDTHTTIEGTEHPGGDYNDVQRGLVALHVLQASVWESASAKRGSGCGSKSLLKSF